MLFLVLLCAAYSVGIILGVSFLVSIWTHLYSFSNHCALFSTGKYEDSGDFAPSWSSSFFCYFSLISAAVSIVLACIKLVKTSVMLFKGSRQTFAITFKITASTLVVVFLTLITGIIVSAGFAIWCNAVEERFSNGCEAAAASMILANNTNNSIDVKGFVTDLETSQFSIWSSLVVWVFALTINGRMLFVAHELANIRLSMARERLRYNHPADHANMPSNLPHRDIT